MKSIKILMGLLTVLPVLFSACSKKEELTNKTYYARVAVAVANLPGTPKLEVRYQGQVIADIPLMTPGASVEASGNAKMSVYVKGTNELVADTTLNLKKGELANFKVAYNKELGISGWLSSKPVSPDSTAIQVLNNLSNFNKTYPAYDFYLFHFDFNTGETVPESIVIPNFQNVKLYPTAFTLAWGRPEDPLSAAYYLGKLKDRATGQFITFGSGNDFFILETVNEGGHVLVYSIDDVNIDVSVPAIEL